MANTYNLISSVSVGSGGTSTITFSSIPQTYTDLVFLITARNSNSNYGGFFIKFNGSTAYSNVSAKRLLGNGSSASSNGSTEILWTQSDFPANIFATSQMYIPNYTSSNSKSASIEGVVENTASDGRQILTAWLWSQSAAVTQVEFGTFDTGFADKFVQYSKIYLYGISNA
jgi:hypothetical protein